MVQFYLAPLVGSGKNNNAFRPPTSDPYSIIDLRGDSTSAAGFCLVASEGTMASGLSLGDSLDDILPLPVALQLESRLKLSLDSRDSLRSIIVELLLRHATPPHDKSRWNRLVANSKGRHRIVLGNKVIYDAPDILNVVVTDDFNRADEALEASASWSVSDADFDIVSNQLILAVTQGRETAHWDDNTFGPNMYTQAECVAIGSLQGLTVRSNGLDPDVDATLYAFHNTDTASDWVLEKIVSGSITTIATTGSRQAGTWRFEVDGSSLVGLRDGLVRISATDTDITVAGFGGFFGSNFQSDDTSTWDDFEAGDITAGFGGMLLLGVG